MGILQQQQQHPQQLVLQERQKQIAALILETKIIAAVQALPVSEVRYLHQRK
jgi:hypothetical protein